MPADTRLKDTAQSILDALAAALGEADISVPERQFITAGDIAHDFAGAKCAEALVVTWDGSFQGLPGPAGNLANNVIQCSMPLTGQFTVALLRCVPTVKGQGRMPTMEELQTSGEAILEDAMTLAAVTVDGALTGSLSDRGCTLIGILQLAPIGPLGGVGGTTMTIVVSLI